MATLPCVIVTVLIDVDGVLYCHFLLSNRGKQRLSENGYVYVKNRKSADGEEVFRYERYGSIYRLISVRHFGHVYLTLLCFTAFTFLENFYVSQTILSAITFVGLCTCNR